MTPAANTRHTLWGRLWRYALLVAVALIFIFPVVFMVVSSLKPDDKLVEDIDQISRSADRAFALTQELMALSRKQALRHDEQRASGR